MPTNEYSPRNVTVIMQDGFWTVIDATGPRTLAFPHKTRQSAEQAAKRRQTTIKATLTRRANKVAR